MSEVKTEYNPEHLEILRAGLAVWNEWRQENPYERPNLSGADLSFIDTRKILWGGLVRPFSLGSEHDTKRLNLANCNLEGAIFKDANLLSVNFSYAYGNSAVFERCDLKCAIMTGSNFSNAEFSGCNLLGAVLGRSDFREEQDKKSGYSPLVSGPLKYHLSWGSGCYKETDFSRCQLTRADFSSACIQGARFENADLRGVTGFVSNENLMRGAIFGLGYGKLEKASDPWVKLKRAYTLPKSILNLLLLGIFLLPYIASALFWIFLAVGSEYLSTLADENMLQPNRECPIFCV